MKIAFLLPLACLSCQTTSGLRPLQTEHELVILHTNDHHGHPVRFDAHPRKDVGGLPARLTLVKAERAAHRNVLVLDAGDLSTGRPESNLFAGEPDIIGYNAIGYDAVTLGNHEFDKPYDALLGRYLKAARFPFLSANLTWADGRSVDDVQPWIVKDFDGFRVAVLGLTTKTTRVEGMPSVVEKFAFADEVETARTLVPKLRTMAHAVIVLGHLGLTEEGSRRLAREVPGIDLIVDGHTHTLTTEPVYVDGPRRVPIVQTEGYGSSVGKVVAKIGPDGFRIERYANLPVTADTVKEDFDLLEQMSTFVERVEAQLSTPVGNAPRAIGDDDVRTHDAPIARLVTDSMLWCSRHLKPDFSVQNGGGIRASLPAGVVTRKHVFSMLPFDNSIVVEELSGAQVQALFDHLATIKPTLGAWGHVGGASAELDLAKGKASNVRIGGKPLDPAASYRVATNAFLAIGGDGYDVLRRAARRWDTAQYQRDCLVDFLRERNGAVSPDPAIRLRRK